MKGDNTMANLKVTIKMDITKDKVKDEFIRPLKAISEDIMEELVYTNIVPFRYGYKGKLSVTVQNENDYFTSWCLLEELAEQENKQ